MKDYRLSTKFNWQKTYADLAYTFRQWGIHSWHITEPPRKRLDDYYASVEERTVTVRFELRGKPVVITMDKQRRAVDNLRVIYIAIEDMRMQERRGIAEIIENAYLQLSAPFVEQDPYDVLGLPRGTALPVCEAQYKELMKQAHPDRGGSNERTKILNEAIAKLRNEK